MEIGKYIALYVAGFFITILVAIQAEVKKGDYKFGDILKVKWPEILMGLILCYVTMLSIEDIAKLEFLGFEFGKHMNIVVFSIGLSYQTIITLLFWLKNKIATYIKNRVNNKIKEQQK